jgi:hypothetical protein
MPPFSNPVLQIHQRLLDTWRSPFATIAFTQLTLFFDSDPKYNSSEARQAFAKRKIKDNNFIFGPAIMVPDCDKVRP